MSIYVKVACGLVVLTFAVFAWALCSIAQQADRRAAEEERHHHPSTNGRS